ncbi:hypothetical protein [Candidatus Corynebacterium faecigallinarum]|uniref:hypothetical protein n=1 Tax=Candidatus Corynebacterium faecigallinarum TaxID=2838528 RepID=UPI003FD4C537
MTESSLATIAAITSVCVFIFTVIAKINNSSEIRQAIDDLHAAEELKDEEARKKSILWARKKLDLTLELGDAQLAPFLRLMPAYLTLCALSFGSTIIVRGIFGQENDSLGMIITLTLLTVSLLVPLGHFIIAGLLDVISHVVDKHYKKKVINNSVPEESS